MDISFFADSQTSIAFSNNVNYQENLGNSNVFIITLSKEELDLFSSAVVSVF